MSKIKSEDEESDSESEIELSSEASSSEDEDETTKDLTGKRHLVSSKANKASKKRKPAWHDEDDDNFMWGIFLVFLPYFEFRIFWIIIIILLISYRISFEDSLITRPFCSGFPNCLVEFFQLFCFITRPKSRIKTLKKSTQVVSKIIGGNSTLSG